MTLKTQPMLTHLTSDGHLFEVIKDVDGIIALEVAGDLAEGVGQILERFYDAVNDGDSIYTSELQALRVMAEMSGALISSVRLGAERGNSHAQ
ncbi:hypothetical protein QAO71_15780 [Halopseudomonas sp. SMJS2]|uniref:hypothetical protein n=1 Tax=Halopseudomonas sp. SMJS2 TaxID=3041098 RepID=UPI0024534695|nr:hypothetical protein [Halopseudomonas sp. SMJS2]WGK61485.1 hypothetical protein QAO71_15780 [Halopseudomonas sp. SMJS2]